MDKEELGQKMLAAGKYLVDQTDEELVGRLGKLLSEFANEQEEGWRVEVIIASLLDCLAYMIADFGPGSENDKRMLLGAASAGLAMLGSDFIVDKMAEDGKSRLN